MSIIRRDNSYRSILLVVTISVASLCSVMLCLCRPHFPYISTASADIIEFRFHLSSSLTSFIFSLLSPSSSQLSSSSPQDIIFIISCNSRYRGNSKWEYWLCVTVNPGSEQISVTPFDVFSIIYKVAADCQVKYSVLWQTERISWGTMVCGEFKCSKFSLVTLNLIYLVSTTRVCHIVFDQYIQMTKNQWQWITWSWR